MKRLFFILLTLIALGLGKTYAACDITVTAPNGGEVWSGTQSITWTGTDTTADATNDCSAVTVNITISGTTPTTVVTGEANDIGANSYSWDTSAQADTTSGLITVTPVGALAGSPDSSDAVFTIDNTAPSAPASAPDLVIASDTGNSDSDDITSDTTPTFDVVCTESDATITLYVDGASDATHACSSVGTEQATANALADGATYAITYTETDAAGNESGASPALNVTIDTTSPVGTMTQASGQVDPTNTSPVVFQVVFDEAIHIPTFTSADIDTTGTTATIGTPSISEIAPNDGTTFEISIAVTADGDVVATVATGSVADAAGNTNASTVNTDNSITYDTTAPVISEVTPVTTPTNDNTPDYVFTSDEAGTISYGGGCTSADTVGTTGNNTITFSTLIDGTYNACTVTVTDAAGNASTSILVSSFTIDTVAPTLDPVSITSDNANSAYAKTGDTITLTFTSDEALTASPSVAFNGGATVPATGGPTAWTVTHSVTGGDTEGVVTFTIDGTDLAGNSLTQVTATTDASSVTIDNTAPDVTIDQAGGQADPTNTALMNFTVVFSEAIDPATFIAGDITIGGTGTATAGTPTTADNITWNVPVTATADGTIIASLGSGVVADPAGNTNTVSTSTDNTVTYDTTAPTLAEVTPVPTPTSDNTPDYTFSSDEDGTISYAGGCTSGTTAASSGNNTITYNTLADGTYSSCTVTVTDAAGNASSALAVTAFTIDTTNPTVTINQASGQADPTNTALINFTVVFSEAIDPATFIAGDITIGGTGTATAGAPTTADNITWNVPVTATADGTITASIASGVVADPSGNTNAASTSTDNTVTYDTIAPTLTYVSIVSDNVITTEAQQGHTITLSFTSDEPIVSLPVAVINDATASTLDSCGTVADTSAGARTSWEIECVVQITDANGVVTFTIDFADDAGNNGTQVDTTTDASSVEIKLYGGGGGGGGGAGGGTVINENENTIEEEDNEVIEEDSAEEKEIIEDSPENDEEKEIIEDSPSDNSSDDDQVACEGRYACERDDDVNDFMSYQKHLACAGVLTQRSSCTDANCTSNTTRKEVAGIAIKLGNHKPLSLAKYTGHFQDVNASSADWVRSAVETGFGLGLFSSEKTRFRPDDSITRAESYAILMKSVCMPIPQISSDWQLNVHAAAQANGLTSRTFGAFGAENAILRQEIFVIGSHLLDYMNKTGGCYAKPMCSN